MSSCVRFCPLDKGPGQIISYPGQWCERNAVKELGMNVRFYPLRAVCRRPTSPNHLRVVNGLLLERRDNLLSALISLRITIIDRKIIGSTWIVRSTFR